MFSVATNKLSITARILVVIFAVGVGFVALYLAIAGKYADLFQDYMMQELSWLMYLLPAICLTAISLLRVKLFIGTEGTGIPQTIASLEMDTQEQRSSLLSLKILFGKILLTTIGLFSGASMGREGPTVHAAACLMDACRKVTSFPRYFAKRGLILAGAAAGIAAAFNAPVAGIVFSIEEIGRSFNKRNLGVVVTVVLVACIVGIGFVGNYWFYGDVQIAFVGWASWVWVPVIAMFMGLLGGLFSQIIVRTYPFVSRAITKRPVVIPMCIGLLIGLVGYISGGQSLGTGFVEAKGLLEGSELLPWYYAPLRVVATALTLLSGIPGGLFDPSLSAGAGFGQWFYEILSHFDLASGVDPKLIMLIAMASFFAGVVQSPITAVVILVEMTDSVHATMPLLTAALIAYSFSKRVCPCSIYTALAKTYFKDNLGGEPSRAACID